MKTKLSNIIKIKSFFYSSINSIVKIFLELFIFDRRIRRVLKAKYCKMHIKKYIDIVEKEKISPKQQSLLNYRIWQYWDEGIENAPEIVKACMSSVDKYKGNLERTILCEKTIKDYIDIPDYIYELKNKGIIGKAHYADIIRTYLLYEYGGCWIDATILLTSPLPEYIRWSELFVFKNQEEDDPDNLNMANYFISSKGNSVIIAKMKKFLEEYWKNNYFVINYFFYLHAFTMFTSSSEENIKEWNDIFYVPYIPVQQMQYELLSPFDNKRFNELKTISPIHKLTYKKKVMGKNKPVTGTLYEKLINGNLF